MKTIVLATDFSRDARQVARFAGQLAHAQNATLVLFHAFHSWPANPAKTGDFDLSATDMRERSEKSLQKLADDLQERIGHHVPIRCVVQEGPVMNAICSVAKTENANLLIMATVGTAPQSAQLMGSIATSMVSETEVPLLLIPPGIGYTSLKNAVLCIDLASPPNAVAFEKALHFGKSFGCVLNVLCIHDKPADANIRQQAHAIRQLIDHQPNTLSIETSGTVYETILTFAHTNKADLIMLLPQTRSWLWKLFNEGQTQRIARLTDIPLLAVV